MYLFIPMDKGKLVDWKTSTSGNNRVTDNSTNTPAKDYLQSYTKYFLISLMTLGSKK